jgi:hypothetical protein
MSQPDDLPPLDDELAAMLRTLDDQAPPADAMARVQAKLSATLSAIPPVSDVDVSAPTHAAMASVVPMAKVALLAFGLGTAVGVGATYQVMRPAERAPVEDAPVIPSEPAMPSQPALPLEPTVAPVIEPAVPVEATPVETTPRVPPLNRIRPAPAGIEPTQDARDRELADENALITRAQNALARGRVEGALEALREHENRFARGQFSQERDAMTIQALAKLGRVDEARTRADAFRKKYPQSMLNRAIDAALRVTP